MVSKGDYGFLSGKIRALEGSLPAWNDYERMIDSANAQAAMRVLIDFGYTTEQELQQNISLDNILERDFFNVKQMLDSFSPEPNLSKLLFLSYDFHNVHILAKEYLMGKSQSHLLSPLGSWPISGLRHAFEKHSDAERLLKDHIGAFETVSKILVVAKDGIHPTTLDQELSAIYYEVSLEIAKKIPDSQWFIERVKKNIDRINGLTVLRVISLGDQLDIGENKLFLENGNYNTEYWLKIYRERKIDRDFPSNDKVKEIYQKALNGEIDCNVAEQAWEGELINQQQELLSEGYGPKIVYVYFQLKRMIAKNLRLIISSKIQNSSRENIMQLLRLHV